MNTLDIMQRAPVIPVLVIKDVAHARPLAEALVSGGLPVLEVTLRTEAAWDAVRAMQAVDGAVVGIGTATTPSDLERAAGEGCAFAVSPGYTPRLGAAAHQYGVPLLPGVATASELMLASEDGFNELKFFPAEQAGGAAMLKALSGPFPRQRFCPTGGIRAETLANYLALPNVVCCGGSWVAPEDAVLAGDWHRIRELAESCR